MIFTLGVIGCLYISCGKATEADKTLLDMTYVYDSGTIYWPTAKHFELNKLSWGMPWKGAITEQGTLRLVATGPGQIHAAAFELKPTNPTNPPK